MLLAMELSLESDDFDAVVTEVYDAVDTLADTRRRAAGEVDALLDGDWTGAAAESFAAAWQEWCAGAEQVRDALAAIVVSLEMSRRKLTDADTTAVTAAHRLLARLG